MLQSNELRVGNIIFLGEVEVTVGGGLIGLINSYERGDSNELGVQEPSGIPLTEDWLLKFRFERVKNRYHDNYKIAIGDGFHSVQIRNGNYFYSNDESDAGCYVITEITYVHQLQNLFFALTGTELTIKEPVNNIS